MSICNVLQTPSRPPLPLPLPPAAATDPSETSCKFNFNGAPPFAESCTSPLPRSLSLLFPPNAVTQQSFSLPCIIFVSREAHGSIRPGWEVQIVTGVMWTGSLHMPPLVPPLLAALPRSILRKPQVENLSLRLPLSFVSFVYSLRLKPKSWIRRTHRKKKKKRQDNHSISPPLLCCT